MKATWPAACARRIGLSGVIDFTPSRVGLTLHVPCSKGSHVVDIEVEPGIHPDFIAKRMLAKGWTIGRKPTCPQCSRREKASPKPKTNEGESKVATVAPKAEPKPDARGKRVVIAALEDYYDDQGQRYRDGHSDATIAKETNYSETFVATIREDMFGPAGEPSEVVSLRGSINTLREEYAGIAKTFDARIVAVERKFKEICNANGWHY